MKFVHLSNHRKFTIVQIPSHPKFPKVKKILQFFNYRKLHELKIVQLSNHMIYSNLGNQLPNHLGIPEIESCLRLKLSNHRKSQKFKIMSLLNRPETYKKIKIFQLSSKNIIHPNESFPISLIKKINDIRYGGEFLILYDFRFLK